MAKIGKTAQILRELGLNEFSFVLDRGFHSHDNLVELIMAKEDFTIGVPLTSQQAKECCSRLRPSLEDSRNGFLEGKRVHYGIMNVWTIEDPRLDGGRRDLPAWIFLDPERAQQQRMVIDYVIYCRI